MQQVFIECYSNSSHTVYHYCEWRLKVISSEPEFRHLFSDQFAFRPTGSITSALISMFWHITTLLQEHNYVHLISLDFSKAFDTVRHHSLLSKLADFPLPDCFHNWLIDYLTNRQHQTKAGPDRSSFQPINASIIQGSGIGPVAYSDLHTISPSNILLKSPMILT